MIKQVNDWMGNQIKEGDEIFIIKVSKKQRVFKYIIPNDYGYEVEDLLADELPDKPCWEVGNVIKVIRCKETMNELGYVYNQIFNEYSFKFYNTLSNMLFLSGIIGDTHILAIKGVSDNEHEYRKNNFKTIKTKHHAST